MADEAAGALDDFDGAGEEYLYLLRPIRDLRRNWEEDICQHLKDYLDSVIEETGVYVPQWLPVDYPLHVPFPHFRFNFVRAAAVIIGNTNIYGKKVDYVHQLALNFFDQIKERQRRRQGWRHFLSTLLLLIHPSISPFRAVQVATATMMMTTEWRPEPDPKTERRDARRRQRSASKL